MFLPGAFIMASILIPLQPNNDTIIRCGKCFFALGSGLGSGIQVFYCGYADNAFGRGYGSVASFTTLSEALAAPQNLTITFGINSITLNWNPVSNASGYKVLSSATPDGTFSEDFTGVFTEQAGPHPSLETSSSIR